MPRTTHGVVDDQTVRERSVVVRAVRADGEQRIAPPRQNHFFGVDAPEHHPAIRNSVQRYSARELGLCNVFCIGHALLLVHVTTGGNASGPTTVGCSDSAFRSAG